MADNLTVDTTKRVFRFNGMELPDINPAMKPDEIQRYYSDAYPQLVNAVVKPAQYEGDKMVFEFKHDIGVKG